jgi:hypothetical protein
MIVQGQMTFDFAADGLLQKLFAVCKQTFTTVINMFSRRINKM